MTTSQQVARIDKKQTLKGWQALFSKSISTFTESKLFIKQVTALAFSCITYMRNIFPENAYVEKELDGKKVKILTGNWDCKDAYLMTRWIRSSFGAIDNEYMKELAIEIVTLDDQPIEYFACRYKYDPKGNSCTLTANNGKEGSVVFDETKIQNSTVRLVNALLHLTESWGPLPKKFKLQLRILYYEDKTPEDYIPKYFVTSPPFNWSDLPNIRTSFLGNVQTNFHSLSVQAGTTIAPKDGGDQEFFVHFRNEPLPYIKTEEIQIKDEPVSSEYIFSTPNTGSPNSLVRIQQNTKTVRIQHKEENKGNEQMEWNMPPDSDQNEGTHDLSEHNLKHNVNTKIQLDKFNRINMSKEVECFKRKDLSTIEEEGSLEDSSINSKTKKQDNSDGLMTKKSRFGEEKCMNYSENNCVESKDEDEDIVPASPETGRKRTELSVMSAKSQDLTFAVDMTVSENSSALELKKFFSEQILRNGIKVRCICLMKLEGEEVFLCQHCKTFQHFVCYKLWPGSEEPKHSYCYICAKTITSLTCADEDLMNYKQEQLVNLAKYRQLIYKMQWYKKINSIILVKNFKIPEKLVDRVISKLMEEGFVHLTKSGDHNVLKSHLKESLNLYFKH